MYLIIDKAWQPYQVKDFDQSIKDEIRKGNLIVVKTAPDGSFLTEDENGVSAVVETYGA